MNLQVHNFQEFVTPSAMELEAFDRAKKGRREFKRKEVITRQGDRVKEIYVLADGWVAGGVEVDLVRTQLVKISLPGDILGLPNISLARAAVTLTAITPAVVDVIPLEEFGLLFEIAPRLAFALFVGTQRERVMLIEQLAVVGQTCALQRLAALLIGFHRRLSVLGAVESDSFDWPLSQEHVARCTGLTAIHVNRTYRDMKRAGLIAIESKRMRLLDIPRLTELAGFPERSFVREPSWLASIGMPAAEKTGSSRERERRTAMH